MGFLIEAIFGFITRGVQWLRPVHIAVASLPYLGAIVSAIMLPVRAARRQ